MPRKKLTELTFKDRSSLGGAYKIIARQNRSDDAYVIEIYEIMGSGGQEIFRGYIDRRSPPSMAQKIVPKIHSEIRQRPVSADSLMWLLCLNYTGLLAIYTD